MAAHPPTLSWTSVAFGFGGYETASRFLLSGLIDRGQPLRIRPLDGHKGNDAALSNLIGQTRLRELVERVGEPAGEPHVRVTFHAPGWYTNAAHTEWADFYAQARTQDASALAHVGFCMFETDRVDPAWVNGCNAMDEIWVPSGFNRETFSGSGVDSSKIRLVPLGLEFERYDPDLVRPMALPGPAGFNFLSVFEWNKRKGYDVLLRAYAEAFTSDDDVALYVRTYGYANAGRGLAGESDLRDYFLSLCPSPKRAPKLTFLMERISDQDMPRLYAACNAFVLPTRGEGWGIPFMEAMAMAKPTIATRWSAHTTFMDDANSYLIDVERMREITFGDPEFPHEYWGHRMAEPSREHLVQTMRQVVRDADGARARGLQARSDVTTRWTQDNAAHQVTDRLEVLATSAPAPAVVLWSSPLLDPSGYADEARSFVLGADRLGIPLRANPVQWSTRTADLATDELRELSRLQKTPLTPGYVHVQHIFPTVFQADPNARAVVGRTMYETDRIPADWVARCNAMDEIWVPSQFNVDTFSGAGVERSKLHVLPASLDAERFRRPVRPLALPGRKGFNFLSIFDWSRRKGWDVLLRGYVEEFEKDEDVSLTIKTYSSFGFSEAQLTEEVRSYVADTLGRDTRAIPKIIMLGGVLSDSDLVRLYRAADAYVMPTRGEGWGRPFMEAMACGLPTIGTNWSGHTAFMTPTNSYLLNYDLTEVDAAAVDEVPIIAGHRWAEPSVFHLRQLMREVFTNREAARQRGALARTEILERYDRPAVAKIVASHLHRILGRPVAPLHLEGRPRVAFLHTPTWRNSEWEHVLHSYAAAFDPADDVTLVLWLDPSQGVPESVAGQYVMDALGRAELDPDRIPDVLLVSDEHSAERVYAAADWVVPHKDAGQREHARRQGVQVLESLDRAAWRRCVLPLIGTSV